MLGCEKSTKEEENISVDDSTVVKLSADNHGRNYIGLI